MTRSSEYPEDLKEQETAHIEQLGANYTQNVNAKYDSFHSYTSKEILRLRLSLEYGIPSRVSARKT